MSRIIKIMRNLSYSKCHKQITMLSSINTLQNSNRYFHSNSHLYIKMYLEHENKYAYNIMENKGYAINFKTETHNTSLYKDQFHEKLQENWSKKSPQEIFEVFTKLGVYCSTNNLCISNAIFDNYIDNFTDNVKLASDKELETMFFSLNKWPEVDSIRTRNYIEVWVALDDECLKRIRGWTHDQMLSFVSLFFMLNVTKASEFSVKCLQKLASKAKQLTPNQLVQTLFFVGILRKQPYDMHNLEIHLSNNFSEFTVDELAIMSMGFFKSKTPIRNMELVTKIINMVMENCKDIHEVSLAALLKLIRYSTKLNVDDKIYKMLDILQHEVPRLSVMCNVHLALVGTSTLTLHEGCLTKIADNLIDNMSNTRVKDLERLVLTYGTFNLIPNTKECFFSKVVDELRKPERQAENLKHGRSFSCCVAYLGLLGIYPVDLMSKALSSEFLHNTYGKQIYSCGREILVLHNTAEIFCSEAEMNRLSDKEAQILAKKYTDYVPCESYKKQYNITERMMLDIMKILKESRGGSEFVIADHILSHHQRGDIILCNDHSGKPIPIKDAFSTERFGLLRRPPDDNIWIVLVIAGRNAIIHDTDTPTGHFQIKVKELETLGFHAVLVPWSVYSRFEQLEDKEDYLCSLINQVIKKMNK